MRLRQKFVSDVPIGKEMAQNLMNGRFFASRRVRSSNFTHINLSYANVLVVDDVPTNLDVAKGMLKPYKMRVDCASGGRQAIDMIRAENPRYDAVFMDHMMPGMDGIEATRIIREQIGTDYAREIPVIALTANAIAGNEKLFLENGFQAFVSKPVDMMRLDSVLRRYVRNKDRERELDIERGFCIIADHEPSSDEPSLDGIDGMAIDGIDIADGIKRFGGDLETYIKVLKSYAANMPPLIGSMMKCLKLLNWRDYAIAAHGIKGASFGIRAMQAGRLAERLENLAKDGETEKAAAENGAFVEYIWGLLNSIETALCRYSVENRKQAAVEPDQALLRELREACVRYDAGKVDMIMAQLESLEYESGAELMTWLRVQLDDMNYDGISHGDWPLENAD